MLKANPSNQLSTHPSTSPSIQGQGQGSSECNRGSEKLKNGRRLVPLPLHRTAPKLFRTVSGKPFREDNFLPSLGRYFKPTRQPHLTGGTAAMNILGFKLLPPLSRRSSNS